MHILFLTDNFPPESNAPASRTFEHCREWVREGHQVTVVTCAPNFPQGKVFSGYRNRLIQREAMEGIQVIRVWSYITANEGFTKRTLDYMSFMVSATLVALFVRKTDIVIGTSPQFFTVCAAYVVGLLKQTPFVFELRDLWPESIRAVGAMKSPKWINRLERLELFLYRKASVIVSVTNSFKNNLTARGINANKIDIVTNGVDLSLFNYREKDELLVRQLGLKNKFVAGYIGTHGMAHALETVVEAAEIIRNHPDGDHYRFIFLGAGAERDNLRKSAEAKGLDNVIFLDPVPKDDVPLYWSLLDVSIIHLKKTDLFTSVIPSKLFECMGVGLPVLHGVAGESAEIVSKEKVGLTFEPENSKALVSGLMQLREDSMLYAQFRKNGLAAAKRYDRKQLAQKMLGVLEGISAK